MYILVVSFLGLLLNLAVVLFGWIIQLGKGFT